MRNPGLVLDKAPAAGKVGRRVGGQCGNAGPFSLISQCMDFLPWVPARHNPPCSPIGFETQGGSVSFSGNPQAA